MIRRRMLFPQLVALTVAILSTTPSVRGAEVQAFGKANQAFSEGRFQDAIDNYQSLVQTGHWSAALFYDLGNAWFRLGNLGQAILNYERALALDPYHPEAQANLRLARDEARALELEKNELERYVGIATRNQYTVAASVLFWLALFLGIHLHFLHRRSARLIALIVVLVALSTGAVFAAYLMETGNHGSALAIVTGKDVEARLATADTSKGVLSLPAGSQIKILSERGDWLYAAMPNGLRGWIPANNAERVRLN